MIRFGPAGNSDEFYEQGYKHTFEAMRWVHEKGLNAFEYSFGRGVGLKPDTAGKIRDEAAKYDIAMSVHAPYYINLSSPGMESREKNLRYMLQTAAAARHMGAVRMVVHPGSSSAAGDAITHIKAAAREILNVLEAEGFGDIAFCPETMGRRGQAGTLEEIVELCAEDKRLIPTIDFGHLYARTQGGIRGAEDFEKILNTIESGLGFDRLKNMHCHFSKIEFGPAGEKRHLIFDQQEYGPDYIPLLRLFAERGIEPVVICESRGTMAKDALSMKITYEEMVKGKEA